MQPLTSDHFLVDNSMLEAITRCPWLAYASIVRRRRPSGDAPPLRFGGFIHRALGYRNRIHAFGKPWSEACMIRILSRLFEHHPCDIEGYRNLDNAVKVIRAFNAQFPKFDAEICINPKTGFPYVEQPFMCDTHRVVRGRKIYYIGRVDVKERDGNRMTFIKDYKTTSKLGDQFWQDQAISPQYRGYLWADREATGEEATGYRVCAIGIRESIQDSDWDDSLGRLVPGFTPSGKPSKAVPIEFMQQPFFTKVPPGQLDEWFENMLNQVDLFLYCVDNNCFPRYRHNCIGKYGACAMYNVCLLPEDSKREAALMSGGYEDNEWTPLYA